MNWGRSPGRKWERPSWTVSSASSVWGNELGGDSAVRSGNYLRSPFPSPSTSPPQSTPHFCGERLIVMGIRSPGLVTIRHYISYILCPTPPLGERARGEGRSNPSRSSQGGHTGPPPTGSWEEGVGAVGEPLPHQTAPHPLIERHHGAQNPGTRVPGPPDRGGCGPGPGTGPRHPGALADLPGRAQALERQDQFNRAEDRPGHRYQALPGLPGGAAVFRRRRLPGRPGQRRRLPRAGAEAGPAPFGPHPGGGPRKKPRSWSIWWPDSR